LTASAAFFAAVSTPILTTALAIAPTPGNDRRREGKRPHKRRDDGKFSQN
jgi:hypothetical protein